MCSVVPNATFINFICHFCYVLSKDLLVLYVISLKAGNEILRQIMMPQKPRMHPLYYNSLPYKGKTKWLLHGTS